MLSITQVAELVGLTPGRIRQLAQNRESMGRAGEISDLPLVDQLRILPEPAASVGNSSGYDDREITRWRAYREGGQIARRAELAIVEAGDPYIEATLLDVLRYPHEAEFRSWLRAKIQGEVRA